MEYHDGVEIVSVCNLRLVPQSWAFAHDNAAAIDAHWATRSKANPGYFNGEIHLLRDAHTSGGAFTASFVQTDFKSYLYWRESGYPAAQATDAFGSAILRAAEGYVLLGRQSAGNINSGLAYLPGGFIDQRDVGPSGAIDIAASIDRELAEETHLLPHELSAVPGFCIIRCGPLLSMAREVRSPLKAQHLRALILDRIAAGPDPELADIVIIASLHDLERANVPPYTALALAHVLSAPDP